MDVRVKPSTRKAAAKAEAAHAAVSLTAPGNGTRIFDARPDRVDFRDILYQPPLKSLPPCHPDEADVARFMASYVDAGLILNQGSEGACTGFGLACVANYLLWTRHMATGTKVPFLPVSPRMLYELAKRYDEWPGADYDGSSCRGALKGWNKHGVCASAMWPYELDEEGAAVFRRPVSGWELDASRRPLGVYYRVKKESVVDIQAAIVNIGAVYVSANVHDGWDEVIRSGKPVSPVDHAALPLIPPPADPKKLGGHAFALVGYNDRGFVVQNSWGLGWGASGFAILSYDDWVVHGSDAWVCALGVPLALPDGDGAPRRVKSSRNRVPSGHSLNNLERASRVPGNPADDPWPIDREFACKAYQPWSTEEAYRHTLVTGNDGELVVTDFTRDMRDKAGMAKEIIRDAPASWFASKSSQVMKLVVYAHGGLNAEDESIRRIRVLAPYFEANDIYPIFLTWKTGAGDTLSSMVQDWSKKLFGEEAPPAGGFLDALGEARDRSVEALGHVLGKGIWSEMRENAQRAKEKEHGIDLLARNLVALKHDLEARHKKLELHIVGHSAGAILLGHFLDRLVALKGAHDVPTVQTCTLFAAACSVGFAVEHYLKASLDGAINLKRLWLYAL
ncbi:MAG: family peptidase protein, partial [Paucimonas sp.]|nr:family peptidase protein [Paucimonas sp.]